MYRYLFGPVPSRRLGRSLGIDLVPLKTCTFDCVFCQVGRTTHETIERAEYVPVDAVAAELFVHPQTVRYRMNQIRQAYGSRLDDPRTILELTVAVGISR